MARDLLMSRSGTKEIRKWVADYGRIVAIRLAREGYGLTFGTTRKYVDEIIANKPWTYPLTASQRAFADNPGMKKGEQVSLIRSNLASALASSLPNFIFWNPGTIKKVAGDRYSVKWPGSAAMWFDGEALRRSNPRRRRNPASGKPWDMTRAEYIAEETRRWGTTPKEEGAAYDAMMVKTGHAKTARLRAGERQGDIFAQVQEPFALAGERGIDHERRQREKEAKAKAARDFDASNQLGFQINPKHAMKNGLKYYVGINLKTDRRQVFPVRGTLNRRAYAKHFSAAIGPFSNLRAAMYVRDHGFNNPQIRCPADAEKLCRVRSLPRKMTKPLITTRRARRKRNPAGEDLTAQQAKSIRDAIGQCNRYIAKESSRSEDLRPAEIKKRLAWYIDHRAKLLSRLERAGVKRNPRRPSEAAKKARAKWMRRSTPSARRKNPAYATRQLGKIGRRAERRTSKKTTALLRQLEKQGVKVPATLRLRLLHGSEGLRQLRTLRRQNPEPRQTNPRRARRAAPRHRKHSPAQLRAGFGGKRRKLQSRPFKRTNWK